MRRVVPAAAFLLLLPGCVVRTISVTTDPPGARVFLDSVEIGVSPAEAPFLHYGTREILVRASGCASVRRALAIRPPWYQWPGLNFVFEVLWPWTIHDRRVFHVDLPPAAEEDVDALLRRARGAASEALPPEEGDEEE